MTVEHSLLTSIHPGAHADATSPSANANDLWAQRTGSPPYQLYLRNAANSAWEAVGLSSTVSGELTATDFNMSGLTGATAGGRWGGATSSGAPVSGTWAVGDAVIARNGALWVCTGAGSPGTWTQGGSVSLTSTTVAISADVTLVSANTFVDINSVSLAAGTWLVQAIVTYIDSGGACYVNSRLTDGTTTYAEGQIELGSPALLMVVTLVAIITLGSTTTIKLRGAADTGGSIIKAKADPTVNSSGSHVTTQINAVKVA